MLKISRNTLDLWLKREEQTGDYRAMTNFQKGCWHKITNWERFREFVKKHGDKTQGQMAPLWGDNVSQQNISDARRKMGVSQKKDIRRDLERDELKRQEFQEQLKTKTASQIVYVDEADIDNRDNYPYGYCKIGQRFYALKSGRRTQPVSWIAALL